MDFTNSAFWMELNVKNSGYDKRSFILELARLKIASAIEVAFLSISLAERYRKTQNDKLVAEQEAVERL